MGRSLQLLIEVSGGKCLRTCKTNFQQPKKMRFFAVFCCIGLAQSGLVRRDADAEPEADADAQYFGGYAGVAPVAGPVAVAPVATSPPVCNSVPVKQCTNTPVSVPRRIAKTLCKTVTEVTTVEDCKEVITTHCTQTSQQVAVSSNVVGQDTVVGPASVVATGHVAVAPHVHAVAAPAVAGYLG